MSEARALTSQLPQAPARLVGADGRPQLGLTAGSVADPTFAGLRLPYGLLQRRLGLPDASVLVLQGIIFVFVLASDALYGRIGFLKGKS